MPTALGSEVAALSCNDKYRSGYIPWLHKPPEVGQPGRHHSAVYIQMTMVEAARAETLWPQHYSYCGVTVLSCITGTANPTDSCVHTMISSGYSRN